jgi:hypothetical protein
MVTAATPVRRRRVKSDAQIRSHIINAMRAQGANPPALLHLLTGFIVQLQEEMKRETEDTFAERACEGMHPGKFAAGVFCRLCHDAQMAGRFGSIMGKSPVSPQAKLEDEDMMDIAISPIKDVK